MQILVKVTSLLKRLPNVVDQQSEFLFWEVKNVNSGYFQIAYRCGLGFP